MKKPLFIFVIFILCYSASAQNQWKYIAPLKCDTWGKPQWTPYDPVLFGQGDSIPEEEYLSFDQDDRISFISPHIKDTYVNNVQIIRWQINKPEDTYDISISNDGEIIYRAPAEQCGVILFPDSLFGESEHKYLSLSLIPSNDQPYTFNRPSFFIQPVKEVLRKAILNELKSCPTIDCKINLLIQQNRLWDAMSVLELEKMRDPDNLALYSVYWDVARKARIGWLQHSFLH